VRSRTRLPRGTAPRAAGQTSTRLALAVLLVSLAAATAPGAVAGAGPTAPAAAPPTAAACGPAAPGSYSCLSLRRTDIAARSRSQVTPLQLPGGFGPTGSLGLLAAYNLTGAASSDGAGETVAIVDAYDQPNAFADVNVYRTTYGIPALVAYNANGSPWFQKVGQTGGTPPTGSSWSLEISLDIDMVSAICPHCNILLVEANSASFGDLGAAVTYAAKTANTAGYGPVVAVSNSYGTGDFAGESYYDSLYYKNYPGVALTAASGDNGYGLLYPASSKNVVAVGGTALSAGATGRGGWTETAWYDAGSGCSANESKPSWQTDYGCPTGRTGADVSAVASCSTPLAVYDSIDGGWIAVCGTSAASPIIASIFALAGGPGASPAANDLYNAPGDLYDVTSGSNGTCSPAYLCTAEVGYDGPTGLGTPDGVGAFTSAAATVPDAPMNVTASAGNAQASVSFSPPAASGGSPISAYTVTSTPDGKTATGTASPITVTGLTSGTAYTFAVAATNGQGVGEASAPSNSVTPTSSTAPLTITTISLPAGHLHKSYSATIQATGGGSPYSWTITPGALPPGLTLAASTSTTDTISGKPTRTGTFSFTVSVADSSSTTFSKPFSITISSR
jgi:subtilase family serine protease